MPCVLLIMCLAELSTTKGLAEGPTSRSNVVGHHTSAVACCDLEREALAIEVAVALPVLAPVSGHWLPSGPGTLDHHRMHISSTSHVGYQDQVEVGMPVDGEPDSPLLPAGHPVIS